MNARDFFGRTEELMGKTHPVTVVVGTLCEGGRAAILVADRFVGTSSWELGVSGPDPKIYPLGKHLLGSFAGNTPTDDVIRRLASAARGKETVSEAANAINLEKHVFLNELRKNAALDKGVPSEGYLDFINDIKRQSQVEEINEKLPSFQLLVIGTDEFGAHLFKFHEYGPQSQNIPGFLAIGIGASLAMTAFAKNPNMKNMSLSDALFQVYHAKQIAAQYCSHVTTQTDIGVVIAGKSPAMLLGDDIEILERIHKNIKPAMPTQEEVELLEGIAKKFTV